MKIHVFIIAGALCLGSTRAAEPTTTDQETGQVNTTNVKKQKAKVHRESAAKDQQGKTGASSGGDYNVHNTGSLHNGQGEKAGFTATVHNAHNGKEKTGISSYSRGTKVEREAANRNKTQVGTDGGVWHSGGVNNPENKAGVAAGDVNKAGREAAARNKKGKKASLPDGNTLPNGPEANPKN